MMKILKKTTPALISGLLIGSGFVLPRPALAKDPVIIAAEATTSKKEARSLFGVPTSVIQLPAGAARQEETNCQASHLYSSHDVVGDPQTCIMNRLNLSGGGVAP
jgi:hypothetical protein